MELIKTKSFELAITSKGDRAAQKVALCLPGRLDTKDYTTFPSHLDLLATKGFYAIAFDPPGTWDSPGGIELFTTTNYIKATNELIEHFGNKPTLLLGHSRGGTVSMIVGASNPAVVGFVAVNATYGSPSSPSPEALKTGVQISYRDLPPGDTKTVEKKVFELPISYFKDGEQYDPIPALETCTKPKLFFYSTEDSFITPEEVEEIIKSLPEPKMSHKLDSDHDYRYHPEVIREVNEVMEEFIDRYLT